MTTQEVMVEARIDASSETVFSAIAGSSQAVTDLDPATIMTVMAVRLAYGK